MNDEMNASRPTTLTVRLFAAARDVVGTESITLEFAETITARALRSRIAREYPELAKIATLSMIAVGRSYVGDDHAIDPRLPVALIPPVSGG